MVVRLVQYDGDTMTSVDGDTVSSNDGDTMMSNDGDTMVLFRELYVTPLMRCEGLGRYLMMKMMNDLERKDMRKRFDRFLVNPVGGVP